MSSNQNNNNQQQGQQPNQDNNNNNSGVMAIGGPHKCNIHPPFETFNSVRAFNDHCLQYPNDHTVYGTKKCEDCDTVLVLNKVPYSKITAKGLDLKVRCKRCNSVATSQTEAQQAGHIIEIPKQQNQGQQQ
jgi:hypothetical protein